MVDAIMGFVVGKMGNYLIEEASMLMGVQDELEELKTELMCIQGYLKDVEARERESEASKVWTKLVLDIAYDVEDVLDSYNLKVEKRSLRRGLMRLTNKLGQKMDEYNIIDDIRALQRRILDVTRKRETYGIVNFTEPRARGNTSSFRVRQLRRARPVDHEERVVGLEDDANILLKKLINDDGDDKRYMISIFGMGGLGKTALARKLYNSEDAKERFDCRAWTYVSQDYNTRDMLLRIIKSLGVVSDEELGRIEMFAEEHLEDYLSGLLDGKKYLMVVDDIWEREAWESLKRALPENHRGCKVIITTRNRTVAEGVDERVYAHKLRFLTFEESWSLFQQKAFRNSYQGDQELQRIGKEMVQKCGGLPLAIVVLAGVMSTKIPNEWNDVYASLWKRLKDNSIYISTVFDLSFKELQHELKLCFLYLSVFPEDYEIDVEMLISLLIAEGFIQEDGELPMEDVARNYVEELIDRSLVEAVRRERGDLTSCRIHDLLRDVAVKKAKEVNFVNVYSEQQFSNTCRREAVHYNKMGDRPLNKRMRSFLFFGERNKLMWDSVKTPIMKLKLLRVLHLGGQFPYKRSVEGRLPEEIGDLIHLRYLRIANIWLEYIPTFISNLRSLQTLHVFGTVIQRRTDLRKLTSLRHIIGMFAGELLLGNAVNLQTLTVISAYSWSKLKPELLINLRELHIYAPSRPHEKPRIVTLVLASFSILTNLRVLSFAGDGFTLSLKSKNTVGFTDLIFPSLESLSFYETIFEEDPMPALQILPRLEDLALKDCDWSRPMKMSINAQGFRRLRKLELVAKRLEELQMEEEAMPSLTNLNLRNDPNVKLMIPDRLRALAGLPAAAE